MIFRYVFLLAVMYLQIFLDPQTLILENFYSRKTVSSDDLQQNWRKAGKRPGREYLKTRSRADWEYWLFNDVILKNNDALIPHRTSKTKMTLWCCTIISSIFLIHLDIGANNVESSKHQFNDEPKIIHRCYM